MLLGSRHRLLIKVFQNQISKTKFPSQHLRLPNLVRWRLLYFCLTLTLWFNFTSSQYFFRYILGMVSEQTSKVEKAGEHQER